MARNSETGHAINVANFEILIAEATSYGTTFNPSKPALKRAALITCATASKNAMNTVSSTSIALSLARNAREAAFKPLGPLVTKANSALNATDTTAQVDATAKTLVRKLQGRRATKKYTEEEKKVAADAGIELTNNSSSQMGIDNRIENFSTFIKLLSSVPLYAPNEADLKITALTAVLNDLKAKNTAVVNAVVADENARIARHVVMYKDNTGLYDIALDVKTYIKSVFGASSPRYKMISKLKFTKPR